MLLLLISFTLGMTFIVESAPDESATVALLGMAQDIGFIAGGAAVRGVSNTITRPRPELFILGFYLFAIAGLFCGQLCN